MALEIYKYSWVVSYSWSFIGISLLFGYDIEVYDLTGHVVWSHRFQCKGPSPAAAVRSYRFNTDSATIGNVVFAIT